jgi:hypothetical protein
MIRKLVFLLVVISATQHVLAQDNQDEAPRFRRRVIEKRVEEKRSTEYDGFKKENIFVGGSFSLGYSSGYAYYQYVYVQTRVFNFGLLPEIGYNISDIIALGIEGNYNYQSYSYPDYPTIKTRYSSYGIGAFGRLKVFDKFFVQVMPELNFRRQKDINSTYTTITKVNTNSFLIGGGYKYELDNKNTYFNIVVLFDVSNDPYSPYKTYTQNGSSVVVPVIRISYNFFPFRKS